MRDAVELILKGEVEDAGSQGKKKGKDAGQLLQQGLSKLAKAPHQALGLDIGAKTQVPYIHT